MIVQKFGGSSIGTPEMMKNVAKIVQTNKPRFVVLSAIGKTTNALYEIAELLISEKTSTAINKLFELKYTYLKYINKLFRNAEYREEAAKTVEEIFGIINNTYIAKIQPAEVNNIIAFGEYLSTSIFKHYLDSENLKSGLINSFEVFEKDNSGNPAYNKIQTKIEEIQINFAEDSTLILQGFICKNHFGEIDNFDRGGSDFSATILGNVINASEIQIWTDTNGLRNNDPRIVNETLEVKELSYREASELAYFGAKILHPKCIEPAEKENIPIVLKNTFNPQFAGTRINGSTKTNGIKAVAAKDGITAIKIRSARMFMTSGFLSRMFEIFERFHTPVDMITTSEVSVSLTIDYDYYLNEIVAELEKLGAVEITKKQSIVCIVGDFLAEKKGLSSLVLKSIDEIPVRMISYGGSENNISVLINSADKRKTLESLQNNLFNNTNEYVELQSIYAN